MADTSGQESALDTDSGKRPESASPCVKETCRHGNKRAPPELTQRDLWLIVEFLAQEYPIPDGMLGLIAGHKPLSAHRRKTVLTVLHARGLVTDEQVERAFAQHPELRSA